MQTQAFGARRMGEGRPKLRSIHPFARSSPRLWPQWDECLGSERLYKHASGRGPLPRQREGHPRGASGIS